MITISLAEIKTHDPCKDGWKKLKRAKKGIDKNEQFLMSDLLETNGLGDCLWALRCKPEYNNLWRKYAVWCARQVQYLMTDDRSRKALDVAWAHSEGCASDQDLAEARLAAMDAADNASRGVAWHAASAKVTNAVTASSRQSLCADSLSPAGAYCARAKQERKLRQILDAGEWIYEQIYDNLESGK